MKRLMNYLRGVVRVRVEGPYPEQLLNLCARERVELWAVERTENGVLLLSTHREFKKKLWELSRQSGCTLSEESSRGLPEFLLRFRRRYGFLLGLALCLLAVSLLSGFVLTIRVTGNVQVPTAVILNEMRLRGIRVGAWGPGLDRKQAAQEVVTALPELSWMAINRSGTRLEVSVREVKKAPERFDEEKYCDIISEADGVITHVQAEEGDPAVKAGDTVLRGDLLIAGIVTMEPPQYSDLPARYYSTHARGRVWARTWREITAAIPLVARVKEYTGEETAVWSLELPGRRIEIFGNSSISGPFCDKISWVRKPGPLPLLRREVLRGYKLVPQELEVGSAQELLELALRRRVQLLAGENGEIEQLDFSARVEDGLLKVTALARCLEEIGEEIPGRGEPKAQPDP